MCVVQETRTSFELYNFELCVFQRRLNLFVLIYKSQGHVQ